jgi:hypothetical protein
VPDWCGVIEAEQGPRGGIAFNLIRSARSNPDTNPVTMAHLLWRPEVLRRPRKQLYEMLSEVLTLPEITAAIRTFMVQRQGWRDHPAPA